MGERKEAVSLTNGVYWQKILLFALPILIGSVFQQLYNVIDSLIAGNFIGDGALASVSSSGSLIFLLVGFFNGVAIGAGVVIGRHYGAKDYESMRRAIHTDVLIGLGASAFLTVFGILATPVILRWMNTPAEVLDGSISYFRIYFAGCTSMIMYNFLQGILQAVGDSRHPLYYLATASLINVCLDVLFAAVFRFGVGSLALATVIAQGVSSLLCLWKLCTTKEVYRLELKKIRFDRASFRAIVRLGLPSGIQNSVISIANLVIQASINGFGKEAMAGCGSYFKIEGFAFLPVTCFSLALTTFVSQNLGAKQYVRAKQGARFGILCSVLLAELIGLTFWLGAPYLIVLFNRTPEVVAYGVSQAKTEALFYGLLAFAHCIAGILRGAGKANVSMIIMLAIWCVLRVTYITVVLHFVNEIRMVFWAYPLTWGISLILFLIYYLKADWIHAYEKKKTV